MRQIELSKFARYIGSPERIVWVVTQHKEQGSICPVKWHTQVSRNPPMMTIAVSPRRYTYELLNESKECVVAWPTKSLAETTIFLGTNSGYNVDKFNDIGLSYFDGQYVHAPLIFECVLNLECRVLNVFEIGDHSVFFLSIMAAWAKDKPEALLLAVDDSAGFETLSQYANYTLGGVRTDDED